MENNEKQEDIKIASSQDSSPKEESKVLPKEDLLEEFNNYSRKVLDKMKEEEIQALPYNFNIFFEKLLYTASEELKTHVENLPMSQNRYKKRHAAMEFELMRGFDRIKNMFDIIITIYKNLMVMNRINQNNVSSINKNLNAFELRDLITNFQKDLDRFTELTTKHISAIKLIYSDVNTIFKNIADQSIFDPKYEVYNKKYLIEVINTELEMAKKYDYHSSLLLIKINNKNLADIGTKGKKSILLKTAKTLSNSIRGADVLAYYEKNIFAILMYHTQAQGASVAQKRISKSLDEINFSTLTNFKPDFDYAVTELDKELSSEEIIVKALDNFEPEKQEAQGYFENLGFSFEEEE